ncbi:MAG: efflux transporter outer membrane subunit [Nitrospirota bacterium]|nr:efflux transporter outer membrane subunit [Nitrospirota bacterium]MDH4361638.1 efflux transporter outer membrane subunit [Nitrospirota bacterium]
MHKCVAIFLSLLIASGCTMGPDYKRPDVPTSDSWRLAPGTSESIANMPWWELFKDEELQKLIRTALQENLDLQVAAAAVEEFNNQLVIAKFDLAPSLDYSGDASYYHSTNNGLSTGGGSIFPGQSAGRSGRGHLDYSRESFTGGIKWEIDLWGRIRRNVEASRAELLARVENQRGVVIALVSDVAQAYFTLRALDLQVQIAQRTLKVWDEAVRLSRSQYEYGYASKLDLDRFEAEQAGTRAQLANLEQQVVQSENRISVLLGHRPMAIPRGLVLTEQPLPPEVPVGLPSSLLSQRPDILEAEQKLVASNANIGVAQAQRFPQFTINGGGGVAGFQINSMATGPFATAGVAGSLTGPLFNATALGYGVGVATAQEQQALARYELAILNAFREVEDSLITITKTREQREAQESQVASLKSALNFADKRYRGGFASYLDVLTAQRDLFQAELGLVSTRQQHLSSIVRLYKALGGGWSPTEKEVQPASSPSEPGPMDHGMQSELKS